MSATVAETVAYSEDSASPLTVSKPASFGAGQMLVVAIVQHNNPSAQSDLVQPSGWSTAGALDGVLVDGKAFYYTYTGSDPASWDFAYKSTADVCAFLFRITSADVSTPTLVVSTTPTTSVSSPMDSPSVTPTGTDDLLLALISDICNGTVLAATVPAGTTDLGLTEVTGHFMSSRAAYQQLSSGSATGVRTWTSVSPTGITGGTWTIAIKSAASGASGSASIAGAGALTALATVIAGAAPAGAGALSALVIERAAASPAGAGALTVAATQAAGAAPAGAGQLSATVTQRAGVSPAGAGAVTTAVVQRVTAAPAATGAVTATGSVTGSTVNGTAALAGAGAVLAQVTAGPAVLAGGQLTSSSSSPRQTLASATGTLASTSSSTRLTTTSGGDV